MRKHLQIDVEHGRIIAPDIHDVRLRLEWPRKVVQIMVRKINTINRHKSVPRVGDAISFPHSLKRLKIKATQQLVVAAENSMFLSCLSDVFYNFFLSQPELDFIFSFFCLSSSRVRKKNFSTQWKFHLTDALCEWTSTSLSLKNLFASNVKLQLV